MHSAVEMEGGAEPAVCALQSDLTRASAGAGCFVEGGVLPVHGALYRGLRVCVCRESL